METRVSFSACSCADILPCLGEQVLRDGPFEQDETGVVL